jgi:polysaccharide export outer membrane protein
MLNSLPISGTPFSGTFARVAGIAFATATLAACSSGPSAQLPPATISTEAVAATDDYVLGPLDQITIHVWRNPELSAEDIQVRPDGRITIPLVRDLVAVGKTPSELEEAIRERLLEYVEQPIVSVLVNEFNGALPNQIRNTGSGSQPAGLPYRAGMTVLDAMIAIGGLGEFAAGNRATLTRYNAASNSNDVYRLRLKDMLDRGDASANVALKPGDTISIPESRF